MRVHDDVANNPGTNPSFDEVLAESVSRRTFVGAGVGAMAIGFFAEVLTDLGDWAVAAEKRDLPFSFEGVPVSTDDRVTVPAKHYHAEAIYPWGHPLNDKEPAFKKDASNTAEEQARQAGMGHDGMQWFPWPGDAADRSDRGLLAINHEYTDQGLLFKDGLPEPMTLNDVRKSQAAHGISVIAVKRNAAGKWQVVDSPYSRRLTAASPMQLTGPAAGSKWGRAGVHQAPRRRRARVALRSLIRAS